MKLFEQIFGIKKLQREPKAGDLLVVEPFLDEEYFERSVVLMLEHNTQNGCVGLILNHCSDIKLNQLIHKEKCTAPIPLYMGGPIGHNQLLFIHTLGDRFKNSLPIGNSGLYLGGDTDEVIKYINSSDYDERCIKFFSGYCAWTAEQLRNEINEKTWVVTSPTDIMGMLSARDKSYWNEIVETLGEDYRIWSLCPPEASFN